MLTRKGQPIGLTEYAAKIAGNKSTHVILLADWDSAKAGLADHQSIDSGEGFIEFELQSRPGYNRLTFDTMTGADSLYEFFEDMILNKKELAVTNPHHLSMVLTN